MDSKPSGEDVLGEIDQRIKEEEAKREKKRKRIEAWKKYAEQKVEPVLLNQNQVQEGEDVDPLDAYMLRVGQQISKEKDGSKLHEKMTEGEEGESGDEELNEGELDEEMLLPKKLRKKVVPVDEGFIHPPFKKDLYREVPEIAAMTDEEVRNLRKELEIRVRGKNCPKPIRR